MVIGGVWLILGVLEWVFLLVYLSWEIVGGIRRKGHSIPVRVLRAVSILGLLYLTQWIGVAETWIYVPMKFTIVFFF